jgi:NAD(P)-dependent dehydrogenase (short-subunit alcohol dehydrogenase family)
VQDDLENEYRSIKGKRIVITGAGRGLGRALAIVSADRGAETVLLGRHEDALNEVAAVIKTRTGGDALVVPCDLGEPDSIATACDIVLHESPRVDVLVNNGAPWLEGRLEELADEDITTTVAAAVSGTILVTKRLLPGLYQSDCPDIITVVSTSGIPGWDLSGGAAPFYAAKHGQSGFSDKLREELKGTGIRVSAIYPPDFEDADPTDASWGRVLKSDARISSHDVVSTLLFVMSTPRTCQFPAVILEGVSKDIS